MRWTRVSAADMPILCRGWRTVVRRGLVYSATMMSSKPMTEMSRGQERPASSMARMAPMAAVSLKQKRAVKSRVRERRSRTGG